MIDDEGRAHVVIDEMPDPKRPAADMYRATFRTVVLTAGRQVASLIDGPDPCRISCSVLANDAPIVLADKSQITDSANVATGIPNPVGALIPQNVLVPIPAQSEISIACPLTAANINRVTVITVHKVQQ
jgi:hypothetical protein